MKFVFKFVIICDLRFKSSGCHEFGDEDYVFTFGQRHFPIVVESDNVGMLQSFEHLGLLPKSLPFRFVEFLLLKKNETTRKTSLVAF